MMCVRGEVTYSTTSLAYLVGIMSGPVAQSVLKLLICRSTSLKETGRTEKKSLT